MFAYYFGSFVIIIVILYFTKNYSYTNWANTYSCTQNKKTLYPKSLKELLTMIRKIIKEGGKVRALGKLHSYTGLLCSDEYVIKMDYLNEVLNVDKENYTVKVEAGISSENLNESLATFGLSMPNVCQVTSQTIGGIIATGSHGTGHLTTSISDFIVSMEIIDGYGNLRTINRNDPLFPAVGISLGYLGIIYSITFKCVDLFLVSMEKNFVPMNKFYDSYMDRIFGNDFYMAECMYPFTHIIETKWNKTNDHAFMDVNSNKIDFGYKLLSHNVYDRMPHQSTYILYMCEHAVLPQYVPYLMNDLIAFGGSIISIKLRFVRKENLLLSPTHDGDKIYFNVYLDHNDDAQMKQIEDICLKYGSISHWAKTNFINKERIMKSFGINYYKFIDAKNVLDPCGTFSNKYLDNIFSQQNNCH